MACAQKPAGSMAPDDSDLSVEVTLRYSFETSFHLRTWFSGTVTNSVASTLGSDLLHEYLEDLYIPSGYYYFF